jgi:hypothetical protein
VSETAGRSYTGSDLLGWRISVYRLTDEDAVRDAFTRAPAHPKRRLEIDPAARGERIAVWQAGVYGLDWIERIANEDDRGISLLRDGYPHWFLVRADDLIPQIVGSPPHEHPTWSHGQHDLLLPNWLGKTTIDKTAMRSCKRNEWLLVEAWDES